MKTVGTLFMEQADVLDLGLWNNTAPMGASFIVSCEITGPLDKLGFVSDFSLAKKIIKKSLKDNIDHRFVVPLEHPEYRLRQQGQNVIWEAKNFSDGKSNDSSIYYSGPASSVYTIRSKQVTTGLLEQEVQRILAAAFASHFDHVSIVVSLEEEKVQAGHDSSIYLRYTHGISQHQGLCHRLWHGHRSQVMVLRQGERSPALEQAVRDKILSPLSFHLAHRSQIVTPVSKLWLPGQFGSKEQYCHIAYEGKDGPYHAVMRASRVLLLEQSTSVEVFSAAIAGEVKKMEPLAPIEVRLYEGVHKGGICRL